MRQVSFTVYMNDTGCSRTARTAYLEENVFQCFEDNPRSSTRLVVGASLVEEFYNLHAEKIYIHTTYKKWKVSFQRTIQQGLNFRDGFWIKLRKRLNFLVRYNSLMKKVYLNPNIVTYGSTSFHVKHNSGAIKNKLLLLCG